MSSNWSEKESIVAMSELIEEHVLWQWLLEAEQWRGVRYEPFKPGVQIRLEREVIAPGLGRCHMWCHLIRTDGQWTKDHSHTRPFVSLTISGQMTAEEWQYHPFEHLIGYRKHVLEPGSFSALVEPDRMHRLFCDTPEVLTIVLVGERYAIDRSYFHGLVPNVGIQHRNMSAADTTHLLNRFTWAYVAHRRPDLHVPQQRRCESYV